MFPKRRRCAQILICCFITFLVWTWICFVLPCIMSLEQSSSYSLSRTYTVIQETEPCLKEWGHGLRTVTNQEGKNKKRERENRMGALHFWESLILYILDPSTAQPPLSLLLFIQGQLWPQTWLETAGPLCSLSEESVGKLLLAAPTPVGMILGSLSCEVAARLLSPTRTEVLLGMPRGRTVGWEASPQSESSQMGGLIICGFKLYIQRARGPDS